MNKYSAFGNLSGNKLLFSYFLLTVFTPDKSSVNFGHKDVGENDLFFLR